MNERWQAICCARIEFARQTGDGRKRGLRRRPWPPPARAICGLLLKLYPSLTTRKRKQRVVTIKTAGGSDAPDDDRVDQSMGLRVEALRRITRPLDRTARKNGMATRSSARIAGQLSTPRPTISDEYTDALSINDHDHSPCRKAAGASGGAAAFWRYTGRNAGSPFIECAGVATRRRIGEPVRTFTPGPVIDQDATIHLCGQSGQR